MPVLLDLIYVFVGLLGRFLNRHCCAKLALSTLSLTSKIRIEITVVIVFMYLLVKGSQYIATLMFFHLQITSELLIYITYRRRDEET